tara:strand:- start:322 stop:807 length:486 start_codon:yes stop_codon:yes gene_type:complete
LTNKYFQNPINCKLIVILLLLFTSIANAAVTEVEKLDFGTLAVLRNDSVSEITINLDNQITFTNHIRVLVPGHRGEYLLSSYEPFKELFISANIVQTETSSPAAPSQQFTLISLSSVPTITTDLNGDATVFVGGTIASSGNAVGIYYDTAYTVIFELSINF